MISRRGKKYIVRVYDPQSGRKAWVGTYHDRATAKEAHRKAEDEFSRHQRTGRTTVNQWAARWLAVYHGPGTARPESTSLKHNQGGIQVFLDMYGDKPLTAINTDAAKDFAGEYTWRARCVAAMFADAVRDGKLRDNPFKGLSPKSGPGREDIDPLTTLEVERLAEIALERLDFYGPHFAAVITTEAWTGVRPGELGGWEWPDLNLEAGLAKVRRQARKDRVVPYTKTKDRRTIVLADPALEALAAIPRMHEHVFSTRNGHRLRPSNAAYYWRPVRDIFTAELPRDHWLPQRLEVDPTDKLDLYELRHHTGSVMAAHGANEFEIAEHLGNSPEVCRRVYIHPFKSLVRDRNREVFARARDAHEADRSKAFGAHRGEQAS